MRSNAVGSGGDKGSYTTRLVTSSEAEAMPVDFLNRTCVVGVGEIGDNSWLVPSD